MMVPITGPIQTFVSLSYGQWAPKPSLRAPLRLHAGSSVGEEAAAPGFASWASEHGVEFPNLQISDFGGLRGMKAKHDIQKDQELVSLARVSAIAVEPGSQCPDDCDKDWWKSAPWYIKMAVMLIKERKLGSRSELSGYVLSLPEHVDVPMQWDAHELEDFQYSPLVAAVERQKTRYAGFMDELESKTSLNASKEELVWALSCIRSRSFSGPYIGSRLSDRVKGAGLVAALALANVTILSGSVEQTLNAIIAVALFNLLYEVLLSRNVKVYLLAPGVDFINHSQDVETDLSYDYFQDAYAVRSDREYSKGDQVFISYGQQANDSLMQYYGFCLPDNPLDFYVIENLQLQIKQELGLEVLPSVENTESLIDVSVTRDGFPGKTLSTLRSIIKSCNPKAQEDELEGQLAALLLKVCQQELDVMGSTLKEDVKTVKKIQDLDKSTRYEWALKFRIEKKKILQQCIEKIA